MGDDLLVLPLDLVEVLAQHLQLLLGRLVHPGDAVLDGERAVRGGGDLAEADLGLLHNGGVLVQGLLGGGDALVQPLISSASFFTWAATTAKPRPSWPARAASMEALMARISVCSTMETIFSMER